MFSGGRKSVNILVLEIFCPLNLYIDAVQHKSIGQLGIAFVNIVDFSFVKSLRILREDLNFLFSSREMLLTCSNV